MLILLTRFYYSKNTFLPETKRPLIGLEKTAGKAISIIKCSLQNQVKNWQEKFLNKALQIGGKTSGRKKEDDTLTVDFTQS